MARARSSSQRRSAAGKHECPRSGHLASATRSRARRRGTQLEEALKLAPQARLENQIGRAYVFLGMAAPASGRLLHAAIARACARILREA